MRMLCKSCSVVPNVRFHITYIDKEQKLSTKAVKCLANECIIRAKVTKYIRILPSSVELKAVYTC